MTLELINEFFGWSLLINYLMLLIWFITYTSATQWLFEMHGVFFKVQKSRFEEIHYVAMIVYKLLIFVFNLVPYLATFLVLHL